MNKQTNNHLTVVVGPYQSGKDTFIYNLIYSSQEKAEIINLAKNNETTLIPYQNYIFTGATTTQSFILNTDGLGNPNGSSDLDIITSIIEFCLKKEFDYVDSFIFVQSLSEPFLVEKLLKSFQIVFGEKVFLSSLVLATKGNLLDLDDLDNRKNSLIELADKYKVKGGVHEFKGFYLFKTKTGELIRKNLENNEQINNQFEFLRDKIKNLPKFDLDNFSKDFKRNTEVSHKRIFKESIKKVQVGTKKVMVEKRKYWFDLCLCCPIRIMIDQPIYESQPTKTNEEIRKEIISLLLKKK